MRFIDPHAAPHHRGPAVGSTCAQLAEVGAAIVPPTYYAARADLPTAVRPGS
ncbi:hypothetical protein [Pseudonocardia sp. TMWB2A]|uniref:hypothetical protein n=1 Tax=Pseudonocardia sp. TMWB2A TaxID=687430 RepID=UPI00307DCA2E